MARTKAKAKEAKIGKTGIKVGIKEPNMTKAEVAKKPTGKPPKVIKMLVSLANPNRAYTMGRSYNVPAEVSVDTARSWIDSGVAEKVE